MHFPRLLLVFSTLLPLIVLVVLMNPIACFHSSDSSGTGVTTLTVYNLGKDISLTSGVMQEISFSESYNVDSYGGPFSSLKFDLQAHLSAVSITVPGVVVNKIPFPLNSIKSGNASMEGAQLFIRMAHAEQEATVCTEGDLYGPFDISLADNFQPESITPATAEATQQTLDIINTGSYSICVQILPVITAIADLNSLEVDFGSCTEPPADIQGLWTGTYECVGVCPEAGAITLEITQNQNDPSIASYIDDDGASYEGRVCGNRFSHRGGVTGSYDESGAFILNDVNSATKTSTYLSVDTGGFICSGTCTDVLVR